MGSNSKKYFLVTLCLATTMLYGCVNASKASSASKTVSQLENSIKSQVENVSVNTNDVRSKILDKIDDNYKSEYEKIRTAFDKEYVTKLDDKLKEKEPLSASNFDKIYDEVFKETYDEFYTKFKSDSIIVLDNDGYEKIYNYTKITYYEKLKEKFVK